MNVGRGVDADWAGSLKRTAIDKRPVRDRVAVRTLGVDGDEQSDTKNHGGPYQAVYAYAREDYDWWEETLGRQLRAGIFGENLTLAGVEVTGALLGERWRVGTAVVEVTGPRIPCGVFRNWLDEPRWVKRFADARRPGAYLRVVEEGEVTAGDTVQVLHRPAQRVTLAESMSAYYGDDEILRRILTVPGHSPKWDDQAERLSRTRRPAGTS